MRPEECDITELIPQRPPMLMIDRLCSAGEKIARGRLLIKASNIFCHEGLFQESGMIEFIGQTAAANHGYLSLSEHKMVKPGLLVQIKSFTVRSLPAANTEIFSEITIDDELLDYTIITGKVFQNNTVIAEGELRTVMQDPDSSTHPV